MVNNKTKTQNVKIKQQQSQLVSFGVKQTLASDFAISKSEVF